MNRMDLDVIIGRVIGKSCKKCGKKSRDKVLCWDMYVYKRVIRNHCPYCGWDFR